MSRLLCLFGVLGQIQNVALSDVEIVAIADGAAMIEERLISESEFRRMLGGISHPTFWKMEQTSGFPRHINFGRRKVWALSEVDSYIRNLVVFSRQQSETTINPY